MKDDEATLRFAAGEELERLGRFDESRALFNSLVERGVERDDPAWQERVAGALMHEAYALTRLDRLEEAILAHFELAGRFAASDVPQVRAWVAGALYSIAVANTQLGRPEEAAAAYDDLIARFGDDPGDAGPLVFSALLARGSTRAEAKDFDGALADYDRAFAIAGDNRERAAQALAHRAWALKQLSRVDEAIAAYEKLASTAADARLVASALVSAGIALEDSGRYTRAVEKYSEVFARFRDDPDPEVRARAARGLYYTGLRLERTGERERARIVFEQVVALYGGEEEGFADGAVDRARRRAES